MNAETMERLLMDRALGALSPDVAALLEAHLRQEPAAAARAAQYEQVTDATRRAFSAASVTRGELRGGADPAASSPARAAPPPFPARQIRRVLARRRRWIRLAHAASLAACLALGVWLGWSWTETPAAAPVAPDPAALAAEQAFQAQLAQTEPPPGRAGFWSLERLYRPSRERRPAPSYYLEWDSPIEKPKLRGAT